jgi:hypothetical protein
VENMGKIIIVDFESLLFHRRPLGVGKFNLTGLIQVLLSIGSQNTDCEIHLTVNAKNFLAKTIRNISSFLKDEKVRFVPQVCENKDDDDRYINGILAGLSENFREVIIVSGDQDFYQGAMRCVRSGKKVYWVSTAQPDERFSVSKIVLNEKQFNFIDLYEYKDRITLEPWVDKNRVPLTRYEMKATISLTTNVLPSDIIGELELLASKYEAIFHFNISGGNNGE